MVVPPKSIKIMEKKPPIFRVESPETKPFFVGEDMVPHAGIPQSQESEISDVMWVKQCHFYHR